MTPEEARSLGRAIRAVRTDRGLTQMKLAVAVGVSSGQVGIWERGRVSPARGRAAYVPEVSREQIEVIAAALGCEVAVIADRAALSAATRLMLGLEPLGPASTVVAGIEYDLSEAETDRVAAFVAGLIAARELR